MQLPKTGIAIILLAGAARAQQTTPPASQGGGHQPPAQAYTDCKGKQAGDTVQHQTPEGIVSAVCEQTPQGLVARPVRKAGEPRTGRERPTPTPRATQAGRYSIAQALSDRAQLHTIAFSGLAFLTGDFAHDTSADLYELDGRLAFERAQGMAQALRSLSPAQRAAIAMLQFGDSRTWPKAQERRLRGLPHEVDVAVMTYASEMFSWYAGSIEADTYFCPERHGMYFGGFGLKTAPAMGKQDYSISTALTGDDGEAFLSVLDGAQRRQVLSIIESQRTKLEEIVRIRRTIATELRKFLGGTSAEKKKVLSLARRYGELDGELSYSYAIAFASVGQSLNPGQKTKLTSLRSANPQDPQGPFLYSAPIQAPVIANIDTFFGARH